jgi:hypothetical protein
MPFFGRILSHTFSDLPGRAVAAAPGGDDENGGQKRKGVYQWPLSP